MLRVLSLGAGVQSSTMALMAAVGELPQPDCAIFACTQGEPEAVYRHLQWLAGVPYEPYVAPSGATMFRAVPGSYRSGVLPFVTHVVTRGNLWRSASTVRRTRDGERTYISTGIPVYTLEDGLRKGIGKRQCTRTFKVEPVIYKCRKLLGLRRVTKALGVLVEMWIGITTDEADRMKPAAAPWVRATWPLIDRHMTRADCHAWMRDHGYPDPPRSACTYCPFRDDDSWLALSATEMADAVAKEVELQRAYTQTTELRSVPYFHDKRKPLHLVKLQPGRVNMKRAQLTLHSKFRNECEGYCGV